MKARAILWLATMLSVRSACGANEDGAPNLGSDYALLSLMTLSPDFAAAHFTIDDGTSDVHLSIARLPYRFDLLTTADSAWQLELTVGYVQTRESISLFDEDDEIIDTRWRNYGGGISLIYDRRLNDNVFLEPVLQFGLTDMRNEAEYNGELTNGIRDLFDGTYLNWNTYTKSVNLSLGLGYDWRLLDRQSSVRSDLSHALVESFHESNEAITFSESVSLLSTVADIVHPTGFGVYGKRLDLVFLAGNHYSFGENRRTLGYTSSYQVGIGVEWPLRLGQSTRGFVRVSGQTLWADGMDGWLLAISYAPDRSPPGAR